MSGFDHVVFSRRTIVTVIGTTMGTAFVAGVASGQSSTPSPATPAAVGETYVHDHVSLTHASEVAAFRAEQIVNSYAALQTLDVWGVQVDRRDAFEQTITEFLDGYSKWFRQSGGFETGELLEVSVRQLGNKSWGYLSTLTHPDSESTWHWSVFIVNKRVYLQFLMSTSADPLITELGNLAHQIEEKWPGDDADIMTLLPELEDLPEGMTIVYRSNATESFVD
jgi:hypothetical protein